MPEERLQPGEHERRKPSDPEGLAPERGAAPYASDTSTIPPVHTGATAGTVIDDETDITDAPALGDSFRTPEPTADYPPSEPVRE